MDDWIFDDIARTYVLDEKCVKNLRRITHGRLKNWPRLLEAAERGLWNADEQVLNDLKNKYLEIESWIEDVWAT